MCYSLMRQLFTKCDTYTGDFPSPPCLCSPEAGHHQVYWVTQGRSKALHDKQHNVQPLTASHSPRGLLALPQLGKLPAQSLYGQCLVLVVH